jgi:hypothetical protein
MHTCPHAHVRVHTHTHTHTHNISPVVCQTSYPNSLYEESPVQWSPASGSYKFALLWFYYAIIIIITTHHNHDHSFLFMFLNAAVFSGVKIAFTSCFCSCINKLLNCISLFHVFLMPYCTSPYIIMSFFFWPMYSSPHIYFLFHCCIWWSFTFQTTSVFYL